MTYTCYFLFQIISFNKYFYVSLGNNFFYCFCGGPLVVEAPGQLPSLPPSLKSGLRRRRRRWPWRCFDGRMSGRVGRCRRWVGSRSGPTVSWHRAPAETSGGWRRPPGCERAGRSPQIAPRTARARPPPTVHHMRANDTIRYDTVRDAILTCARKPTRVSLIYRTEPTSKKCKTEKLKSSRGHAQK